MKKKKTHWQQQWEQNTQSEDKNKQKHTGNIENITHSMKEKTNKARWQHWEHNTQYEDKNKQKKRKQNKKKTKKISKKDKKNKKTKAMNATWTPLKTEVPGDREG